jgi:hypothetical protein
MFTTSRKALTKLEYAAGEITAAAGRPTLQGSGKDRWFRFADNDVLQIIAVKSVRVVSGLNACFRLLEHGFAVEAAVVLRTVDDFVDEITFLLEGHQSGKPTRAQQEFIKQFFEEADETGGGLNSERKRPDRVKRKNIQASQGRYLNPVDPDTSRKLVEAIDHGWNGYVHGAYRHSMELYDPYRASGCFRMNGTDGTPYPESIRKHLVLYISRSLSLFGMVALHLNREALKEELVTTRNSFESSSEYISG